MRTFTFKSRRKTQLFKTEKSNFVMPEFVMPESLPLKIVEPVQLREPSLPEPVFKLNFEDFEMQPMATSTKIGGYNLVSWTEVLV